MPNPLVAWRSAAVRYAHANPTIPQTIAAFAIKLAGAVLSFGFAFLVAREFGAAGTGTFGLALATGTIASTLALFGLDFILLRTIAGDLRVGAAAAARGTVRLVLASVCVSALGIAAILALATLPQIQALSGLGLDTPVVRLAALAVLPLALTRVAASALRGAGHVLFAQLVDGTLGMALALTAVAALLAARVAIDVGDVFRLYVGAAAASVLLAWLVFARTARRWPPPATVPLRPMLGQSWKIAAIVLSSLFADWLVLLLLDLHFGKTEVGQFRIAWQITGLITMIVVTFDAVAGPSVAAAHRVGETEAITRIWRQSIRIMTLLSLPLLIATIGFPAAILGLFGAEFEAAASALRILALGQLFNVLTGPIGTVLLMTGRERWLLRNAGGALIVLTVLGFLLIPTYGLVGAAWTTSLTIAFRKVSGCLAAPETLPAWLRRRPR